MSKSKKKEKDKRILEIRTEQTGALKHCIEMISNVISDCCIVFVPPDDDDTDVVKSKSKKSGSKKKSKNSDEESFNERPMGKTKELKKGASKGSKKASKKDTTKGSKKVSKKSSKDDDDIDDVSDYGSDYGSDEEVETKKSKKKGSKQKESDDNSSSGKQSSNTGGIKILRLTEDKNILIKLNLEACQFEYFYCIKPKITIGVDMNQFHSFLKTLNDNNPIVIYMNSDNRSSIFIRSVNEKEDGSEETDIELLLMDIPNSDMVIDPIEFQNKVTMTSEKFNNICKHLNNNSSFVEITSVGNQISFKGKSDGGKVTKTYKDPHQSVTSARKKKVEVVQGIYELRNLMSFSKCNKLCHAIDLYLRNDYPLVLTIAVANLGKMYIFLTPIENGSL